MNSKKTPNALVEESSPYLLQHAHNPVSWFPWKTAVLENAKANNKLLLISIGYSTCHWCHVMEKDCFEDEQVAEVMNAHFVNIKVDREERPDVDQVYMNALQAMTGSGGWPLNIVALPDGRPVWGATYVQKSQWIDVLNQLQKLHSNQPNVLIEYAEKMAEGLQTIDLVTINPNPLSFSDFDYEDVLSFWARQFDRVEGGTKGVTKFMMPNNYQFLLRYAFQTENKELLDYVHLTLKKMAFGGIYDHINGGFSRYSVDEKWHIPHFEKMLYDNAQLVSLYSDAFRQSKDDLYKEIVFETLNFIERELTDNSGAFYSALDADSINEYGVLEEGAYYVFKEQELKTELKEDFEIFAAYYNINDFGKWENNHYVLIRTLDDHLFCLENKLTLKDLKVKKTSWKKSLREHRKIKARPRLDYKTLTAWNALMIKAYTDAYKAFASPKFLVAALKCAHYISENLMDADCCLHHSSTQNKKGPLGFLDDYALLADAFISLYETTFDEKWVVLSKKLMTYCFTHFYDKDTSMFYYTSHQSEALISRTIDFRDNVIPASNSVMAKNLFWMGLFFDDNFYTETSKQMLKNMLPDIEKYPPGFSNWLDLCLNFTHPFYEIIICGEHALENSAALNRNYILNKLLAGSPKKSNFPLLSDRFIEGKTFLYVCEKGQCHLPFENIEQTFKIIKTR